MRRTLALAAVVTLAFAAVAMAAGPTIKVAVTPDTPSAHSTLKVSATGPFSESGLPKSLELTAQNGFQSSAKAVPVLCKTHKVKSTSPKPCPAKSKVGSGKAVATLESSKQTLTLTMYLGTPQRRGDIASIVLSGRNSILGTENVIGRLFKARGGSIEILFRKLIGAGFPATLKSLTFSAHAVSGKHSLITNPLSCKGGHWTGSFKLTFSSGSVSKKTSIPCTK